MTTEEEIKHRHAVIAECQGAIKRRLDDIDRMRQLDITQPNNLTTGSGHPIGSVSGDLLREVLVAGRDLVKARKLGEVNELESRIVAAIKGEENEPNPAATSGTVPGRASE